MERREIVGYLLWCAIGVLLTAGGLKYGLGTPKHLGSGFIFVFTGFVLILLSGGLIGRTVYSIRRRPQEIYHGNAESKIPMVRFKKLVIPIGTMLIYCSILEYLGFLISASLLMLSLFYFVGKKSGLFSLITSITISLLSYMLFSKWLGVQLPAGIIPF